MIKFNSWVGIPSLLCCLMLITVVGASVPLPAKAECRSVRGVIPIDNIEQSVQEFGPVFWLTVQRSLDQFGSVEIEVDGANGAATRAALQVFQEDHGLNPSGNVDTETLRRFLVLWEDQAVVPPFTTSSRGIVFNPDFVPKVSAVGGVCRVTLEWEDEIKSLDVTLRTPINECRLTQFQKVPTYVQSGPVIGVMLDIMARGYNRLNSNDFIAPVIAIYPDRQTLTYTESFEKYAWALTSLVENPQLPDWEGPFESKDFDFHRVNTTSVHWYSGHGAWMFRPWDMSDCD